MLNLIYSIFYSYLISISINYSSVIFSYFNRTSST